MVVAEEGSQRLRGVNRGKEREEKKRKEKVGESGSGHEIMRAVVKFQISSRDVEPSSAMRPNRSYHY